MTRFFPQKSRDRWLAAKAHCLQVVAITATLLCLSSGIIAGENDRRLNAEFFERQIRPLLENKCVECHGADLAEADLRLESAAGLFRGSEAGAVIAPYDPDGSRLIQLVRGRGDLQMPPDDRLETHEIAALEKWVRDGAVWPGYGGNLPESSTHDASAPLFTEEQKSFWSFRPIRDPPIPTVTAVDWPTSPVDNFILSRLEAGGISTTPPADKRTLLRRVTYDLVGLPPTPREIADFLADNSPDALEKVVDRLLASPRYGEKWAQHWLDVVRFAESAGHDGNNAYLHAWRYRDYVIQAMNDDKPFDQFIVEQLAGDLLPETGDHERDYQQNVATGFLQVGPKPVVMRDKRKMLLDIADEQLHTTGVAFLGLTLGCARCHDHKFDPIPTQDYYSLAGMLTSTQVMADAAPDSKWLEKEVPGPEGQPVKVMFVHDSSEPKNLKVHLRGNYRTLGVEAPRRFLRIIAGEDHPLVGASGSGRLELARWIASRDNPLTARVAVNRLWQHHFGRGIVPSSGNFGMRGEAPLHPELLDWLATRFVESGWSTKAMHRLVILSSTYQQAHVENQWASAQDPENRLLWRMPRRRLTAEQLRDTLHYLSGELDLTMGGTLFTEGYTENDPARELYVVDISGREFYPPFLKPRRSIYLPVIRNGRPELHTLFDSPHAHEPTSVRGETTVAPQSLFLMNSSFVQERAYSFAGILLDPAELPGLDHVNEQRLQTRIERAYEMTLGRLPTVQEAARAEKFLNDYQLVATEIPVLVTKGTRQASEDRYVELVRGTEGLVAYHRLGGIELNGVDQVIEFGAETLNNTSSGLSVECWIMPRGVSSFMMIVGRDGPTQRLWKIGVYGKEIGGEMQNVLFTEVFDNRLGGHRVTVEPRFVAPLEEWTHVVFTCGNSRRRLYVNGQIVDELAVEGEVPVGSVPLTIGARGTQTEWFHGRVNHVAVFHGEVDEKSIREHYRAFREIVGGEEISPEQLAWRAFCQSLFCLNEFIFVD